MKYNVKIDAFEGPLDLLLHLINTMEINIYDIPMAEITDQYFIYVHTMKELELDVASEYLVMAATLLSIKSKMLLPQSEEPLDDELDVEFEEDPREELVERLMEYKKFKEAARQLREKEEERGKLYTKPPSDLSEYTNNTQTANLDVTIYDMLGAFHKLLRRKKLQQPLSTKVTRQEISIAERMKDILEQMKNKPTRINFFSLFTSYEKEEIVVTFLSTLELMMRNEITVSQQHNFGDIYLYKVGGEALREDC